MWLRDSSAQVWPYVPLQKMIEKAPRIAKRRNHRQTKCILIDPYANASISARQREWEKDLTTMKKELHERKYEIDSLCYPIRLLTVLENDCDASVFDDDWRNGGATNRQNIQRAARFKTVQVRINFQRQHRLSPRTQYQ